MVQSLISSKTDTETHGCVHHNSNQEQNYIWENMLKIMGETSIVGSMSEAIIKLITKQLWNGNKLNKLKLERILFNLSVK